MSHTVELNLHDLVRDINILKNRISILESKLELMRKPYSIPDTTNYNCNYDSHTIDLST